MGLGLAIEARGLRCRLDAVRHQRARLIPVLNDVRTVIARMLPDVESLCWASRAQQAYSQQASRITESLARIARLLDDVIRELQHTEWRLALEYDRVLAQSGLTAAALDEAAPLISGMRDGWWPTSPTH